MIELQKIINVEEYMWCRSAALVKVIDGKSALTGIGSDYTDYYSVNSVLLLNGKPLVQGDYPVCSTCCALLARGYGIENINCEELQIIRERVNSAYVDIQTSIRNIEPILNLLDNGYYVVADAAIYPTDGEDHFFANVPDKLSTLAASCSSYYVHDLLTAVDSFPAFLYPTQSNSVLNAERAEYYYDMIDKDNAPRAIAYYDSGFVCALLDGHHKAYAAAKKGSPLSALVIIRNTGGYMICATKKEYACFSEIEIPLEEFAEVPKRKTHTEQKIQFDYFHNEPIAEKDLDLSHYPTVSELAGLYAAKFENITVTKDLVEQLKKSSDNDDHIRLKYLLQYYAKCSPQQAHFIAKTVVSSSPKNEEFNDLISLANKVIANN